MALTGERFFITGGALPQDAPSYVLREADRLLYASLCDGEFCYILDTRQSGKSSLKVRAAIRLRQESVTVVDLDLTRIGQPTLPDQWYYGLLLDIGDQLNLVEPLREFWRMHKTEVAPLQRWFMALRQVVLEQTPGQLVLFIDEIDAVRSLSFSTDEFFAGIRECYHRRPLDPAYERLTLCLLGVAVPADLIRDVRTTPFNIGRRIELKDFTLEEATSLAGGLQPLVLTPTTLSSLPPSLDREGDLDLLNRILFWTGGHPYLTQRLCRAIAEYLSASPQNSRTPPLAPCLVDRLCAELFLTAGAREIDDNLAFVSNRILHSSGDMAALLTLYRQVWSGRRIRDDSANPLISELKMAGIVRVQQGRLQVRNRIYRHVFDSRWVQERMPEAEVQRQRAAYRQGLIRASSIYGMVTLAICGLALATLRQKQIADRNANHARTAETHARIEAARANLEAANARRQLYFANMELAPREWENSRVGHLLQLLEETKNNENRNWEWNYWNRVCHSELLTLPQAREVASVAISPDGTCMAIPDGDTLLVCDAATGHRIRSIGEGYQTGNINAVAYSPDGRCLATGNGDRTVRLWDPQSGRLLLTFRGQKEPVSMLSFSVHGKRLLTTSFNSRLSEVWDAQTGRNLLTLPHVGVVALSPDGQQAVTGGNDGTVRVWSVDTGRQLASWPGNNSDITSIVFSPDGRRVATGSQDGMARVWGVAGAQALLTLKHANDRIAVAFSSDSKRLLTSGYDGTVKVWDAQTGRLLLTLRHPAEVETGSFFPDGQRIVTVSGRETVRVWDAWKDRHALVFPAHRGFVLALAFSPDGKRMVTSGKDSVAKVWDTATYRKLLDLPGHASTINSVAYSPDGKRIVTGSNDATARVWDAQTGSVLRVLKGGAGWVNSVAWSPDGRYIATGHNENIAKVWDARTGREVRTLRGHTDHVLSVAFSPDSRHLVTAGADYRAKVWDMTGGHESLSVKEYNWLWAAAFSPDGRNIVIGCQDDSAKVYDIVTRRERLTLQGHTANVRAVAFSPDGKRIVTGSHDGTLRMWDAVSGRETLLLAHPPAIYTVAFSPDGRRIATGGVGGSVQIWSAD